jgi:hypothetical protein
LTSLWRIGARNDATPRGLAGDGPRLDVRPADEVWILHLHRVGPRKRRRAEWAWAGVHKEHGPEEPEDSVQLDENGDE